MNFDDLPAIDNLTIQVCNYTVQNRDYQVKFSFPGYYVMVFDDEGELPDKGMCALLLQEMRKTVSQEYPHQLDKFDETVAIFLELMWISNE